jgi:hypothetical protein
MSTRHGAFLDDLKERMRKFELALHPDKTRLIRVAPRYLYDHVWFGTGLP